MTDKTNIIGRLIEDAQRQDEDAIRADLFDRYMAEPYGDEVKGSSGFVSSDVSDVVDAVHVDIMDVFTSSDRLLEFVPVGAEDEEAAQQETDAVAHMFWQKADGFTILHNWVLEGLIQQNSYIKYGWVEKERITIEEYEGLSKDELLSVVSQLDGEYEILDHNAEPVGEPQQDPMSGEMKPQEVSISVKIRCTKFDKEYEILNLPQEEFFMTPRWPHLSLVGIDCCGHKRSMERAALIAMGFSEKSIDAAGDEEFDTEQTSGRWDTKALFQDNTNDGDNAARKLTVYEAYVRADIDDEGKVRLWKVWSSGDGSKILQWENGDDAIEEVSHVPFVSLTPHLIPHRHAGRSVSEKVTDVQKVKSVVMRHTLDNLYKNNYARPMFDENMAGEDLYADLANPAHGAPIRTGGALVDWARPMSVIDTTLPILAEMDNLKENRTGATRYSQGLDKDSLNKTMGGMAMMLTAGMKKNMMIARTIAETALRDLFLGIHRDLRNGPMKELVLKLRGKWVEVNPRTWVDRTDMNINVGMGSGNRDQTRAALQAIGDVQRELIQGGSSMVNEQNLFNTTERFAATFGFKSIDAFLQNPETAPPPTDPPEPPEPDALMISAQAQMDKVQADAQAKAKDQEIAMRRLEMDHEQKMAELEIKGQSEMRQQSKTASDIQTDEERLDLDRDKAMNDDDFRRDKLLVDTAQQTDGPGYRE